MQQIYDEVKTPYKYGLVVTPENESNKIDCPSVFRKGNSWYMTYIQFEEEVMKPGWQKVKILQWKTFGKNFKLWRYHNADAMEWDANQKAGYIALQDHNWGGSYKLQKFNRKYWLSYIGGKEKGYETGKLSIGIANTDKNITRPHAWKTFDPVLSMSDIDVRWWENKKLFKSSIIWDKEKNWAILL